MFVLQGTYDKMRERAERAERGYFSLQRNWNQLVDKINEKGGEQFLQKATIPRVAQFSKEEIAKLIQLCHPDKHDGKPMAVEITQRLLDMKRAITE
jgi:hypothetical protein